MPTPFRPEVFGDFLLVQRLARGAFAEVLLAVRLGDRTGRSFVVKRPPLGERASGRAARAVAREAEVLGEARAPELVALEAAGDIAGLPFVAIDYVRGAPLDVVLAHEGPLPPAAARAAALDTARALAALHAAGWVHGDVSPSNVLIDDAGEVRLADLGVAERAGTRRRDIVGKPGYVPPEAVQPGEAACAADVYAWGVVVAECLTGARLFDERDLAEAAARGALPVRVAQLGAEWHDVAAALQREPTARPSASKLAERLAAEPLDRAWLAEAATRLEGVRGEAPPPVAEGAREHAPGSSEGARAPAASVRFPPPPSAPQPTPTVPMVAARTIPDTAQPRSAAPPPAPLPAPLRVTDTGPPRLGLVAPFALGAFIAGAAAGVVGMRARGASIAVAGALPRRVQIEIDGRPVAQGQEAPTPLRAGRHEIGIKLGKGEQRVVPVALRPGEHILLVPLYRDRATQSEPPEDAP